jgi:FMN reductase
MTFDSPPGLWSDAAMATIVVLSGSPSASSRTAALTEHLAGRLEQLGHQTMLVRVRDLPAQALIGADATDPEIAKVVQAIQAADGLLVASPIYKAAYTGVLKSLLDLLPHMAFAGKVVLPLLTGAGQVHSLALDYALRPVLSSLGPYHIVPGIFVVDKDIERTPDGIALRADAKQAIDKAVDVFAGALNGDRAPESAARR